MLLWKAVSVFIVYAQGLRSEQVDKVTQCLQNEAEIAAWYDGDSIDVTTRFWYDTRDKTKPTTAIIDETTGIGVFDGQDTSHELYLNGKPVVYGTVETKITFHSPLNPENYTVFNVCKYRSFVNATKGRILQTNVDNTIFGFHNEKSGVAYSGGWITRSDANYFGDDWVYSAQQYNYYRANGLDLTNYANGVDGQPLTTSGIRLKINQGQAGGERSDFACAELLVFDTLLSLQEIECIEQYLSTRYKSSQDSNSAANDMNTALIVFGCVIGLFLLAVFLYSCVKARAKRSNQDQPTASDMNLKTRPDDAPKQALQSQEPHLVTISSVSSIHGTIGADATQLESCRAVKPSADVEEKEQAKEEGEDDEDSNELYGAGRPSMAEGDVRATTSMAVRQEQRDTDAGL